MRLSLVLLLLPALQPTPVAAQSRAELEARAASLRSELDGVEQAVRRRDSLRRAREGWQEIRRGGLVLEVLPGDRAVAERAATIAWDQLGARYAAFARGRPARLRLADRRIVRLDPVVPGSPVTTPVLHPPLLADSVAAGMVQVASEIFWSRADSALRAWLPQPPPLAPDSVRLERIYVQLVTTRYDVVARCFRGDLAACRGSLGLPDSAGRIPPGYDAADLRALARRAAGDWQPGWSAEVRSCVSGEGSENCDRLARAAWRTGALRPLELDARAALAGRALAVGGPGSFDRLIASEGLLPARLGWAADQPFDSVLGGWRRSVLAARPPGAGPGGSGWTALGWSLLLFGAALGASRWR